MHVQNEHYWHWSSQRDTWRISCWIYDRDGIVRGMIYWAANYRKCQCQVTYQKENFYFHFLIFDIVSWTIKIVITMAAHHFTTLTKLPVLPLRTHQMVIIMSLSLRIDDTRIYRKCTAWILLAERYYFSIVARSRTMEWYMSTYLYASNIELSLYQYTPLSITGLGRLKKTRHNSPETIHRAFSLHYQFRNEIEHEYLVLIMTLRLHTSYDI